MIPQLPEDVLVHTFAFLPARSLLRVKRANRYFFDLTSSKTDRFRSLDVDLNVCFHPKTANGRRVQKLECRFSATHRIPGQEVTPLSIQSIFRVQKASRSHQLYTIECDDAFGVIGPQLRELGNKIFRHYRPVAVSGNYWALSKLVGLMPSSLRAVRIDGSSKKIAPFLNALPQIKTVQATTLSPSFFDLPSAAQLDSISCQQIPYTLSLDSFLLKSRCTVLHLGDGGGDFTFAALRALLETWQEGERELKSFYNTLIYNPACSNLLEIVDGLNIVEENVKERSFHFKIRRPFDENVCAVYGSTHKISRNFIKLQINIRDESKSSQKASYRFS